GLQRSSLTVRERDEAGLRHGQRVAAGGKFLQIVDALIVGQGPASAGNFGGVDEDARALDGASGVGGDDASADAAGGGWRRVLLVLLGGGVTRRPLLGGDGYRERQDECRDPTHRFSTGV